MENDKIQESMNMIAFGGQAKNLVFEALREARGGDFERAQILLDEADEALNQSHQSHTNLLFYDAEHGDLTLNLFMVHAADHLNSASMIRELANEMIEMIKEIRRD